MISPNGKVSFVVFVSKVDYYKEKGWKEEAAQTIKSSSKTKKEE